ncbi:MAG: flagellar hook-associated protein FlgK [bacterium]|nr:flagellar hook-associated protein FlgK [bacterium]
MPSIFLGLEIARKALAMSQLNLQVIAHNIANAGTPGYSRQRAEMITSPPLAYPSFQRGGYPQQIGTGVDVDRVMRIRDEFLDEVIRAQTGSQGRNETVQAGVNQIELIFNEPGDNTLGTLIDNFFAAWSDLANNPELVGSRANVREEAISMTGEFNRLITSLDKLAQDQKSQVRIQVDEANNLAHEIALLNTEISQVTNLGDDPNDLKDRRDLVVEQLAEIIPVTTIEDDNGSLNVLIGGLRYVDHDNVDDLKVAPNSKQAGEISIEMKSKNAPDFNGKGSLAGLLEVAYDILPKIEQKINNLATAIVNRVNLQHIDGFGLDGQKGRSFFSDIKTAQMAATFTLPAGTTEDTTLDVLGISAGYFTIQGQKVTISKEDIVPGDAITLKDLLDRINESQPYVRAKLESDALGNSFVTLNLYNPGAKDTEISVFTGTSNFIQTVGLSNAASEFISTNDTYTTSANLMSVWQSILENLDIIAAAEDDGSGNFPGAGNNGNAIAISDLQSLNTAIGTATFTDFYTATISELGSLSQSTTRLVSNQGVLINQLNIQRESIRGVNLDEEATQLYCSEAGKVANTTRDQHQISKSRRRAGRSQPDYRF